MKYRVEILMNEYGTSFGENYIISEKGDKLELISKMINIIGEEYYYSVRDVWNQIHISFED